MNDINWLRTNWPKAFDALPVPYQNDDCLFFELMNDEKDNETIMALPKPSQVQVLGHWNAFWSPGMTEWVWPK